MSRSPPGVSRVVAMINFFVSHADTAYTLSDVARTLQLSPATCHGLLTGLVTADYIDRTPEKTYMVGPALLSMCRSLMSDFSPLDVAQPAMRALVDELECVCTADFREGREIIVRARTAAVRHLGYVVPSNMRLPLQPEVAGVFFADCPSDRIKASLHQIVDRPTKKQAELFGKTIEFVRRNGFMLATSKRSESASITDESLTLNEGLSMLALTEFRDEDIFSSPVIHVPVRGQGEVSFVLILQGFLKPLSGLAIVGIAGKAQALARKLERYLGHSAGRLPAENGQERISQSSHLKTLVR